ncbi:hypothetical protein HaLaN_01065 [Haematococcus lacustris]|uniref:Uncharacterized protein n=1 Tax=Haematococcus lacustris TaxID=44745 RepID=A0A699YHR6_HAELA|nr:hypothetical protein HaLaN_01065 [Haematococcus lacustris]
MPECLATTTCIPPALYITAHFGRHSMNSRENSSCWEKPQPSQSTSRNGSAEAEGHRQAEARPGKEFERCVSLADCEQPSRSPQGKRREDRGGDWKTKRRQVRVRPRLVCPRIVFPRIVPWPAFKVPRGAVLRGCKKSWRAGVHSSESFGPLMTRNLAPFQSARLGRAKTSVICAIVRIREFRAAMVKSLAQTTYIDATLMPKEWH